MPPCTWCRPARNAQPSACLCAAPACVQVCPAPACVQPLSSSRLCAALSSPCLCTALFSPCLCAALSGSRLCAAFLQLLPVCSFAQLLPVYRSVQLLPVCSSVQPLPVCSLCPAPALMSPPSPRAYCGPLLCNLVSVSCKACSRAVLLTKAFRTALRQCVEHSLQEVCGRAYEGVRARGQGHCGHLVPSSAG